MESEPLKHRLSLLLQGVCRRKKRAEAFRAGGTALEKQRIREIWMGFCFLVAAEQFYRWKQVRETLPLTACSSYQPAPHPISLPSRGCSYQAPVTDKCHLCSKHWLHCKSSPCLAGSGCTVRGRKMYPSRLNEMKEWKGYLQALLPPMQPGSLGTLCQELHSK